MYQRIGTSWKLLGIISEEDNAKDSCDYKVIEIDDYYDSIKETVEKVTKPRNVELHCLYFIDKFRTYCCFLKDFIDMKDDNFKVIAASRNHKLSFNDRKVLFVLIENSKTFYLPTGIGNVFKNLKQFFISKSSVKFLDKKVFKGMKNVEKLLVRKLSIQEIPKESFDEMVKLKEIVIKETNIKTFDVSLLEKLINLELFEASENHIEVIDLKLFRNNHKIQSIDLSGNRIKIINGKLAGIKSLTRADLRRNECINEELFKISNVFIWFTVQEIDAMIKGKCSWKI